MTTYLYTFLNTYIYNYIQQLTERSHRHLHNNTETTTSKYIIQHKQTHSHSAAIGAGTMGAKSGLSKPTTL